MPDYDNSWPPPPCGDCDACRDFQREALNSSADALIYLNQTVTYSRMGEVMDQLRPLSDRSRRGVRSDPAPDPYPVVVSDEDAEGQCFDCGTNLASLDNQVAGTDDEYICTDCRLHRRWSRCQRCSLFDRRDSMIVPVNSWNNRRQCSSCTEDYLSQCCNCGDWYEDGLHYNDMCESCSQADDCYSGCDCYSCEESNNSGLIMSYTFKPRPVFHDVGGNITTQRPARGQVYLGMELEINRGECSTNSAARVAHDAVGNLAYLKDDSSVSGFELVTHPMSHNYAATSFPWAMLDELTAMGCTNYDAGIHVHVNRTAFDSPSHVYRWLRFIYRNRRPITAIARRDPQAWGSFAEPESEVYDYTRDRYTTRKPFVEFAKGDTNGHRYSAVNVQNEHTFEVRVFASSLKRQEVMAALDLVHASVEYTRNLTVPAIVKGGWTWDGFIKWVSAEGDTYAALLAEHRERVSV